MTFEVPAERVEAHLPSVYELDTFERPRGRVAFVSTTCFCNQDFRLVPVGYPKRTFDESTYRTYVTHRGRGGIYFFGRYLGDKAVWLAQRAIARDTYLGDFDISIRNEAGGYAAYECHVGSSQNGSTAFSLEAAEHPIKKPPFRSAEAMTRFLTYRLHGFFTTSAGVQGRMPVSHPLMHPVAGTMRTGLFDLWSELEILYEDELAHPYSVLVVDRVPFTLFPPRPLV